MTHPEQIRQRIETTQQSLRADVDALHDRVSPSAVAGRQVDRARHAATGVRDRVMGTASSGAHAVEDAASSAVSSVDRGARGNPLAAGLIAFGAGWLVSSLFPASRGEQRLAERAEDVAREHASEVTGPLGETANELKDNLRQPAQEAAEAVRSTAADAATTVQDEARSAAQDVGDRAQDARETVRQQDGSR